ncbi:MAG: hypothetical protein GX887_00375 [Firmicutes bacterium]|nr:hypothetical protein [Bacillota bacterium]
MVRRWTVGDSTAIGKGYSVLLEGAGLPDSKGWYRLEKSVGFYRGTVDMLTGTPHDIKGELRLEYGDRHCRRVVTYVGPLFYGLMQGTGRIVWPCGTLYKGNFKDGCRHGSGVLILPDGQEVWLDYDHGSETHAFLDGAPL